ncbi:MAG: hypothetical protein AAF573_07900, partial [Bacteroidota bacterium]
MYTYKKSASINASKFKYLGITSLLLVFLLDASLSFAQNLSSTDKREVNRRAYEQKIMARYKN